VSTSTSTAIDWLALHSAAERVSQHAYAPYSNFHVGAALLCEDGRVFTGCNVENASFGLSLCAERNAVFSAVAANARRFVALLLVTSSQAPVAPCGACRQVLVEFPPSFPVRCYGQDGSEYSCTSAELLPHAFGRNDFHRP
jgi:cytidine deaminase